ncbi:MAG: phage terminase large subunit [Rhodospirillales bacterium]
MPPVNFAVFVVLWNNLQGLNTPDLHIRMAQWLQGERQAGHRELLLMAFRNSGKSTLVGLFCAWMLWRDPDLRIMVLAADLALARKMVRNVKRIIERHPLTRHLKPPRADQWASEQFTVNRRAELRDPSMLARGIGANLTGSRADVVICDDVEVPNTCDTAPKRADLRARLAEIEYVLVPGGNLDGRNGFPPRASTRSATAVAPTSSAARCCWSRSTSWTAASTRTAWSPTPIRWTMRNATASAS